VGGGGFDLKLWHTTLSVLLIPTHAVDRALCQSGHCSTEWVIDIIGVNLESTPTAAAISRKSTTDDVHPA
jgi:hypothetical protein